MTEQTAAESLQDPNTRCWAQTRQPSVSAFVGGLITCTLGLTKASAASEFHITQKLINKEVLYEKHRCTADLTDEDGKYSK